MQRGLTFTHVETENDYQITRKKKRIRKKDISSLRQRKIYSKRLESNEQKVSRLGRASIVYLDALSSLVLFLGV